MSDRGDYRSFYSAFWDDPDVHALSDAAYRVLTTLKGTLPASGIGVVYLAVLAERCGKTVAQVEESLTELEAPKPGADLGWIRRERNIVWIINGLRFEPTLTSANSKHRTFLRERLLAPLGERTAIVVAFRRYYGEWFEDAAPRSNTRPKPDTRGTKVDSHKNGNRNGIGSRTDTVSDHNSNSNSNSNTNPEIEEEELGARERFESAAPETATAPPVVDPLTITTLTVWANRAATERWGEQPTVYTSNGQAIELAEALTEREIDPEVVRRSIYRQCRALKADRPPRSIKYFLGGIEEDWQIELAKRALAASGEEPPPRTSRTPAAAGSAAGPGERSYQKGRAALEDL